MVNKSIKVSSLNSGVYSSQPQRFAADVLSCACVLRFNEKFLF